MTGLLAHQAQPADRPSAKEEDLVVVVVVRQTHKHNLVVLDLYPCRGRRAQSVDLPASSAALFLVLDP